jgi:hypothetical protein
MYGLALKPKGLPEASFVNPDPIRWFTTPPTPYTSSFIKVQASPAETSLRFYVFPLILISLIGCKQECRSPMMLK